jgi:YegS/Rv2252/BmrU family lipid kinase
MRAVIVNPASASGRTEGRWRRIVAALEAGGEPLDVQLTSGPGDAITCTRRALDAGAHRIVVLGGDGTLGEVVAGCIRPNGDGMLRDDVELAVIHQGTGGDLARGLDLPKTEDAAIDVALHGAVRRIDVGIAGFESRDGIEPNADAQPDGSWRRGFVSTANVGMAAEVVQQVTGRLKRLGNNGSFAVATVGCLARNKPRPVVLSTREGLEAQLTIVDVDVCNNRFMGGGMLVAPDASFDDGMFDVIVIAATGRARLIRTFPKIYSGRHVDDPLVRVERTAELTVGIPDGAEAEGVVLDGELVGSTPATFRVIASALSVRVPHDASGAAVER